MKLLDAMNRALPYLQAPAVTSVDARHPMAVRVREEVEQGCTSLNSRGWWYNTVETTLPLTPAGKIEAPNDALALYTKDSTIVEIRGELLYDLTNLTDLFTSELPVRYVLDLGFESLPELAAEHVMWAAAHAVYCTRFDASDATAQTLAGKAAQAGMYVDREHLRKKKFSILHSGAAARIIQATRS